MEAMSGLAARLEKIPEFLAERAARYPVPGASLAVLADGEVLVELLPVTETLFCWTPPRSRFRSYVTFNEFDEDGRALRIDSGTRTFPRVGR